MSNSVQDARSLEGAVTPRGVRRVTHAEWLAEAQRRFPGMKGRHWKFVCPACGTVQTGEQLMAAGVKPEQMDGVLGFSCIGRWTHQKPPPKTKGTQDGCNWTLGGLLTIHTCEVVFDDGKVRPVFEFAEA